jgi:AraC family transcriptional regulator
MVKIAGDFLFRLLDLGGIRLPVHRHDQAKMSIVLRGEFTQQIGSKVFDCSDKTLLVKGAGIEHSDTYARVASCLTIDVSDPRMFDGFARATPLAPTIVARILSELRARDAASRFALEGLALELAAMATRREEQATAGPAAFRRACEFLADHLAGAPAMSDVAAFAGVHPSHLRRLFQTYAGCSPAQWLRSRKIDAARDRLLHTDTSISGIAFELGFYDQSHFTNMFREVTGTTPAAYRRREDV